MMKNSILFVLSFALLMLIGCGNSNVGLSGKVVFSDDGSPVPVGRVVFVTNSFQAYGDLQPDGTFVISSIKENDGLPSGKYRVCIAGAQRLVDEAKELYEPLVAEKFTNDNTSGIEVEVTASTKTIEIKVDRHQSDKR